jgi:hypothetical protein
MYWRQLWDFTIFVLISFFGKMFPAAMVCLSVKKYRPQQRGFFGVSTR